MIPVMAVIGTSKTGKTTLIEYLISYLSKEGLKIGTIKHIHDPRFSIDTRGKDSWRHAQAGAKVVVSIAPTEIAIIKKEATSKKTLETIIDLVKGEKLDLLIIEGFHSLIAQRRDIFKVITAKSEENLKRTLKGTVDPILFITGPFARQKAIPPEIATPIIDFESGGRKMLNLVRSIIQGG